jgi:hypothetical protein
LRTGADKAIRPDELPDIESVVSAVELLAERHEVELAPFVQSWDPTVDGLGRKTTHTVGWERDLREGLGITQSKKLVSPNDSRVRNALLKLIRAEIGGSDNTVFSRLRDELIRDLPTLVKLPESARLGYLSPLLALGRQEDGVTIATLNYDLAVETAAEELEVPVSRGIETWADTWRLGWQTTGIRLMKLHGSIDWFRQVEQPQPTDSSAPALPRVVVRTERVGSDLPFVVYGRREKLRAEGPFLDLREAFVEEMQTATLLVVVGYSFGDEHVNELVRQWIGTGPDRKLVVIDPNFPQRVPSFSARPEFPDDLIRWLDTSQASKVGQVHRLHVFREAASLGLARICTASDRHLQELLA